MIEKSRQKLENEIYLENEKNFYGEIKSIFYIFKGLSVVKNCLTPYRAPLNYILSKTLRLSLIYWNLPLDFVPLRKDWALVMAET